MKVSILKVCMLNLCQKLGYKRMTSFFSDRVLTLDISALVQSATTDVPRSTLARDGVLSDAIGGTAIGLPIRPGVVEKGSIDRQSYGSPMEHLGYGVDLKRFPVRGPQLICSAVKSLTMRGHPL